MTITISPVHNDFVAEIGDVDLANLSAGQMDEIKEAFWQYGVLVFPDQKLSQEEHVAFAKNFGPMDVSVLKKAVADQKLRIRDDIADVSNLAHLSLDFVIRDASEGGQLPDDAVALPLVGLVQRCLAVFDGEAPCGSCAVGASV